MSPTPESSQEPNILSKVASVVGLLGAALFFTGWIYRWSYFYFFQLEVTTLDLPVQSFFIVPLQVFFGSFASADSYWLFARTVGIAIATLIGIQLTFWLLKLLGILITKTLQLLQFLIALVAMSLIWLAIKVIKQISALLTLLNKYQNQRSAELVAPTQKSKLLIIIQWLRELAKSIIEKLSTIKFQSINFRQSFLDEVIIVVGILIALFLLARDQGTADAQRDAGPNSTLPVVTLVMPENRLALGRKLEDEFLDPSLKGYRIIGDRNLFNDILGQEQTDLSNPESPIIWRLLIERGGWIYLFPALPKDAQPNDRPLVLAIQTSTLGEQMLIMSPEVSKPRSR